MSGCGGSGDSDIPKVSPTPSPTRSTTGTLLDNVPTTPDRPEDVRSEAGAFDFASHVNDTVFYVLATNDIGVLYDIADRKLCRTCGKVQDAIDKRPDRVQVEDGSDKVLTSTLVSHDGDFYTVRLKVAFPEGAEINTSNGKVHEELDAQTQAMNVNMQWRKGAWVLLDYTYADPSRPRP